ncbi:cupin domain-containing protein [Rhodococcus sp. DMU1]|uniref:cupin domain-containing protein n=1 Tax=Rhodococcus sp. DMU1 TaxID=2722825 RepID=UPI00143E7B60|nr:cupin domain-containing protein [Rhodococcus sp. DMU1]QIX53849.1 cupin domain-containing protein [Rhodococcus sp. DMU1]
MIESIKRVITGVDDAGNSTVTSSGVLNPVFSRPPADEQGKSERIVPLWQVWGTPDGSVSFEDLAEPVHAPLFPGPGGTRFLVFVIPPDSTVADPVYGEGQATDDLPGLREAHETAGEDAAFHATDTIDYCFVAEGEVVLELDGGRLERLTRGSCVVQRGTRHAWRNPTDQPALIVVSCVGVLRDSTSTTSQ